MWFEEVLARASAHAELPAVADERRVISYGQLRERSACLAGGLLERGIRAGDRVAVLARNSSEVIESFFAINSVGASIVPLNYQLTPAEVAGLSNAAGITAVIGEERMLEPLQSIVRPERSIAIDTEDFTSLAASAPAEKRAGCDGQALSMILLTSATTAEPKGVRLSDRAVRASALSWLASVRPPADAVYFNCPPLFHSTVLIALSYLGAGALLVLTRDAGPQRALEIIERHAVTHMYMVPSMLALTLRTRGIDTYDHTTLKEIFHGGAPMSLELRREAHRRFGVQLRDCYGQAEAGGPITVEPPRDPCETHTPSAGLPLLGVELRVSAASGDELPAGETGEVWVRSDALMDGYITASASGESRREDGRWLPTGDIGYLDSAGELHIVDRLRDVIIRGGQNIYPSEIEEALSEHPAVLEVAVIARPDRDWGEVPAAFVVPTGAANAIETELAAFCRRRLAPYKRPVDITLLPALPRNAAGKILKRVLQDTSPGQALVGESG